MQTVPIISPGSFDRSEMLIFHPASVPERAINLIALAEAMQDAAHEADVVSTLGVGLQALEFGALAGIWLI